MHFFYKTRQLFVKKMLLSFVPRTFFYKTRQGFVIPAQAGIAVLN
jgi:hypothetical protein